MGTHLLPVGRRDMGGGGLNRKYNANKTRELVCAFCVEFDFEQNDCFRSWIIYGVL